MNGAMILILGVTASGKSRLASDLAHKIGAEIISVDSMKVYRRMDIGTAKPPEQARRQVKYHLIDIAEPSESFSAARFLELANTAIGWIKSANRPIIAVGGTAMYIKALLYGLFEGPQTDRQIRNELKKRLDLEGAAALHAELASVDPPAAERIDPNDARRIVRALEVYQLTGKPISAFQQQRWAEAYRGDWRIIGLRREKADASHRINMRVKGMIQAGLVDEVKTLLAEDKPLSTQARCAIGYGEIIDYINGGLSLDEAIEKIKINTRRFAKAQRTWFKGFRDVNWLDVAADEAPGQILERTVELIDRLY